MSRAVKVYPRSPSRLEAIRTTLFLWWWWIGALLLLPRVHRERMRAQFFQSLRQHAQLREFARRGRTGTRAKRRRVR